MRLVGTNLIFLILFLFCGFAQASEETDGEKIKYDYVTDTAKSIVDKATALVTGDLEIQAGPQDRSNPSDYTRDAIGRKVPKSTAVKAGGSLHSDQPL
ncbi:MAG: hypothetical protein KBB52_06275 [Candidatus Omnitrophica bacterium]|nr:hypothetical protein [Candidatus Omnitrophota bacterium]